MLIFKVPVPTDLLNVTFKWTLEIVTRKFAAEIIALRCLNIPGGNELLNSEQTSSQDKVPSEKFRGEGSGQCGSGKHKEERRRRHFHV